jgi:hypothetical protein
MSKWAAINTAVCIQLALDGRQVDYKKSYGTRPAQDNTDDWVELDRHEMRKFLLDVATRLKCDEPPWVFAWRTTQPEAIFGNKLAMMITLIEDLTERSKDA